MYTMGPRLTATDRERIVYLYHIGKTNKDIHIATGKTCATVAKVLKKAGLPNRRGSLKAKAFASKKRILAMYPEFSLRAIGKEIGVEKHFVKKVLVACGVEIIKRKPGGLPGCRLPTDLQTKIIGLFKSGRSLASIARETGKRYATISRLLKSHGFKARRCGRRVGTCNYTAAEKALIISQRELGWTVNAIADGLGKKNASTVSRFLKRVGKFDCTVLPENKLSRGAYIGGRYLNALSLRDTNNNTVSPELASAILLIAQRMCPANADAIAAEIISRRLRLGMNFKKGFSAFSYWTQVVVNMNKEVYRNSPVVPGKVCVSLDSSAVSLLGL